MTRAIRFMLRQYILPTTASMAIFAAVSLVGSQIWELDVLSTWYAMLPMFAIMFAVIYSWTLVLLYRSLALTMNCRRQDFFWASQVIFLLFAVIGTALTAAAGALPQLLRFGYAVRPVVEDPRLFEAVPLYADPRTWPILFLFVLVLQPMGTVVGELYFRHKVLATVLMVVFMLLSVASVVVLMFMTDGTLSVGPTIIAVGCAAAALLGLVCDIIYYRTNKTAVVR